MKSLFFSSFLLLIFTMSSQAQDTIKIKPIVHGDSTWLDEFCSVAARGKLFSSDISIAIDYGDNPNNRYRLRDKKGNVINFTSVIDALNYLGEQGWHLVNALNINYGVNSAPNYVYIMRREYWGKKPKI